MPKRLRIVLPLAAPLMILAIAGIASFQVYWMRKLYGEEWTQLRRETDIAFRDVVYKLQMQHFSKDTFFTKHDLPPNLFLFNMLDSLRTRFADSFDPGSPFGPGVSTNLDTISGFSTTIDAFIRDSGGVSHVFTGSHAGFPADSGGRHLLEIWLQLTGRGSDVSLSDCADRFCLQDRAVEKSYYHSIPDRADPGAACAVGPIPVVGQIADQLPVPGVVEGLCVSGVVWQPRPIYPGPDGVADSGGILLLLGFTVMAFVVLYRNLQQQQRLAQYKNDFISNMTHELKTPISTIKVAVEALRHFDALDDPKRSREYLDISALELQRLSMLVDKVLKLSQFENRVIEFRLTTFDLRDLAAEVIAEMRLPFEKAGAVVQVTGVRAGDADEVEERFDVRADRSHLSSVISNLLDNALKYSRENPVITVEVAREAGMMVLSVTDNGMGIPAVYLGRVFDKFFRVPSGDHHNIKGYGLGLNYVQHIVQAHRGRFVTVESKEGKGQYVHHKIACNGMSRIKVLYAEGDEIFLGKIVKETLDSRGSRSSWQ